MNWSVLLLHLASAAATKKICGTAPIFISCFSGLHFRCNYRKLREQGPSLGHWSAGGADSYNVPTSALHNVTTQNLSKILTHLVVDGTQKVYDKYINKGRKNLRMSFSHSFLPPPVQCDVESVAALIRDDVILWIMYVAVWWWWWCGKGQHINTDASYSQSSSTKLLPPSRDQNNIPTLTHFYLHHPPNILMSQSFVRIAFYFYI